MATSSSKLAAIVKVSAELWRRLCMRWYVQVLLEFLLETDFPAKLGGRRVTDLTGACITTVSCDVTDVTGAACGLEIGSVSWDQ